MWVLKGGGYLQYENDSGAQRYVLLNYLEIWEQIVAKP